VWRCCRGRCRATGSAVSSTAQSDCCTRSYPSETACEIDDCGETVGGAKGQAGQARFRHTFLGGVIQRSRVLQPVFKDRPRRQPPGVAPAEHRRSRVYTPAGATEIRPLTPRIYALWLMVFGAQPDTNQIVLFPPFRRSRQGCRRPQPKNRTSTCRWRTDGSCHRCRA
jgi:hypothetical protein